MRVHLSGGIPLGEGAHHGLAEGLRQELIVADVGIVEIVHLPFIFPLPINNAPAFDRDLFQVFAVK